MEISLIAALAHNRVIGKGNQLPWHMPADLQYFKRVTMGKPIVMGRKSYASIGRPLPGRRNIVITQQVGYQAPGCDVVHSLAEAIHLVEQSSASEAMVIGGAQIFTQAMSQATRLYLTYIDADIEGDVFFPEFDIQQWHEVSREAHAADAKNPYDYTFTVLRKAI
jgi:dihydrofolate reductase